MGPQDHGSLHCSLGLVPNRQGMGVACPFKCGSPSSRLGGPRGRRTPGVGTSAGTWGNPGPRHGSLPRVPSLIPAQHSLTPTIIDALPTPCRHCQAVTCKHGDTNCKFPKGHRKRLLGTQSILLSRCCPGSLWSSTSEAMHNQRDPIGFRGQASSVPRYRQRE